MVFLFPGILFRRTFFSGKFSKHYDSGNIVDRVLWNIFFSIICILLFILVNIFTNNILISSLGISLRQNEVINTFEELYKNEFPKLLRDSKSVNDFIWILLSLYIFSTLLGLGLHKLIFIFDLDKHIPLLKFQSKWDYLLVSNKESNKEHRLGDVFFTQADLKLLDNQLYTGRLHDIVLNKENHIESIILSETYKFYKIEKKAINDKKLKEIKEEIKNRKSLKYFYYENQNEYCYKKRIKGDLFTIPNSKVENISITYVKMSTLRDKWSKNIIKFRTLLLLLVIFFSIAYGIWDFGFINFQTVYKRIAFCIMLTFNTISLMLLIINLLSKHEKKWENVNISIVALVLGSIPYLYIFWIVPFYYLLPIFILTISVIRYIKNWWMKKKIKKQIKESHITTHSYFELK
jgi:membrane protein